MHFSAYFVFFLSVAKAAINPKSGLTPEEAKVFLDRHNVFRRETAKLMNAQNMNELVWDDYLAEVSYAWAKNCEFKHGMPDGYDGDFGQNLYMTTSNTNKYGSVNIWFNEYKFYDMNTASCDPGPCGHYTQLVWADTKRVGCGHYQCPELDQNGVIQNDAHHVVCQYDPPGNYDGKPPISIGPLCSRCPGGKGFCDDGLCVDQCPSGDSECECRVFCDACGEVNEKTCSCDCKPGFKGPHCEEACGGDLDDKCGRGYPAQLCTHDLYRPTMLLKCPATCKICGEPLKEDWTCGTLTYGERFIPGHYVGYLAKHGRYGECVFPFEYEGVSYDRCTEHGSVYPEPWCGTNKNATVWGHCVPVVTFQGAQPGKACNFPFIFHREKRYKCIGDEGGYYWCGLTDNTDVDSNQFGYCNMTNIPEREIQPDSV